MKLTIELTPTQREELQAEVDRGAKLVKKFAGLEKRIAGYQETRVKATARLAKAEETANEKAGEEAGEEASAKAFAIRDQLFRLGMTLKREDREREELEEEAANVAFCARTKIRAAHRPLVESLIDEAAAMLAPWCELPHLTRDVASQLYAVDQMRLFTRSNLRPDHYRSSGSILSDIEAIGKTLAAMLAGEAVVTAAPQGEARCLVFPNFC